jgi:hypothetical protein
MALTAEEKARTRYHLGYPNVTRMTTLFANVPAARQTGFLLEQAMDVLLPDGEALVRDLICKMDRIDCQLIEAAERMQASAVGNLKMREDEQGALEQLYQRFGFRLADVLGVPVYPLSRRYQTNLTGGTTPTAGNLRTLH